VALCESISTDPSCKGPSAAPYFNRTVEPYKRRRSIAPNRSELPKSGVESSRLCAFSACLVAPAGRRSLAARYCCLSSRQQNVNTDDGTDHNCDNDKSPPPTPPPSGQSTGFWNSAICDRLLLKGATECCKQAPRTFFYAVAKNNNKGPATAKHP
jgi:hypothetical protein